MRRFIRYLYEYEQGKRIRNVGFVNVEQDDMESTLHIHGKGLRLAGGDALELYLFYEEDGRLIGILQGEIAYMGPSVNYRLKYTGEDTGTPENFERIRGILLKNRSNRKFAAVWDDAPADVDNMRLWTEQRGAELSVDAVDEEDRDVQTDSENTGKEQSAMEEERTSEEDWEAGKQESASGGERLAEAPENILDEVEETDADVEVQQEERGEDCPWKITKIQRAEISMLPRCEWRLANNHFLLHGYYNYRHLVLLDDGKVLRLGVPGIYHEKEARAASGFGFPEFISADKTRLSLSAAECSEEERFGYWCRQVRKPVR